MRKSNSINSNFVIPKSLQNKCSAKLPLENNYQHDFLLMLFLTGTSNNSYNDCAILIGSHFYWTLIIIWHDYSKDTITNPWNYFRQWYLASIDSCTNLYIWQIKWDIIFVIYMVSNANEYNNDNLYTYVIITIIGDSWKAFTT